MGEKISWLSAVGNMNFPEICVTVFVRLSHILTMPPKNCLIVILLCALLLVLRTIL